MVELTNVIALENMRARFNSAFDMTPAGFSEGMVCAVAEPAPAATAAVAPSAAAGSDSAPDRERTPAGTTA